MKTIALTLGLMVLPALTLAWDESDGKPRNSYERQQETYRQHGYDTYRNGPLPETLVEERRRQEQQRQREDRQRQEEQHRSSNSGYGQPYR
ncbi:MAG: hypothetical protein U0223_16820 [Nitrospira sp.]|nr:hypothetical protein [Nitrospira sp.]